MFVPLTFLLLLLVIGTVVGLHAYADRVGVSTLVNYQRIEVGMREADVQQLLGSEGSRLEIGGRGRSSGGYFKTWDGEREQMSYVVLFTAQGQVEREDIYATENPHPDF